MKAGDTVFYRQKEYKVLLFERGYALIKRAGDSQARWVRKDNLMLLKRREN